MNAQQRKIIRDAHVARLGGIGARVRVSGAARVFTARLHSVNGCDQAFVIFDSRTTITAIHPVTFEYKAARLTPA